MEYINGRPAATQDDLIGVLAYETLKKMVQRGNIERARRGCYERPALYYVDTLPAKYKAAVYHRFPDLQGQKEAVTLMELLEVDHEAVQFYADILVGPGEHLPAAKQEELTNNASILNAIALRLQRSDEESLRQGKPRIKRGEFWRKVAEVLPRLADHWPHSLPGNPVRLAEKFKQYQDNSYVALISNKFGNQAASKLKTDYQKKMMMSICKAGNNLNDVQAAMAYNQAAKIKGWPRITAGTVANFRLREGLVTFAGSRGVREFKNNKAMQVKRSRPTGAMLFWVHDGWTAEFYYRTKDGYANRMNLEVVLDPCCNYPIGYAISTHENVNVIVEALGNAVRHARELFGDRFIPYQIQSDNYARTATKPVYLATCTHYIPAAVGNAKAKVVEPYFSYLNTTYAQWMKNWSGFGVKSRKEVQPSPEWLNANKHNFPTEEEVIDQITKIIYLERTAKHDQYMEFWSKTAEQYKRVMGDEMFLLTYGWTSGKSHILEGCGLRVTIDGQRFAYDSFDIAFREDAASKRWIVRYDPQNLSRVLAVSTDERKRYILEQKYVQPMALADRKPGDAEQLQRVFNFNKRLEEHVAAKASSADEVAMAIFSKNTELDNTLAKHIITDSRGQHKNQVSRKRLAEAKASAVEVNEMKAPEPADEDFDFAAAELQRVLVPRMDPEQDEEFNRFDIY
jgi:hypothetical protein